jgi:3'-phosphoadenosine 5'-phosphosulfate sulfotransferase (PAPS reductase)/FAD synthetase
MSKLNIDEAISKTRRLFSEQSELCRHAEYAIHTIRRGVGRYDPSTVVLMFSGGHDSSVLVDWFDRFIKPYTQDVRCIVGHINTNIGIPDTREFAREFSEKRSLEFLEVSVEDVKKDPNYSSVKSYEEFVKEYGFPGPGQHKMAYSWLKYRPILKMTKDLKQSYHDRVMFITGVRRDESNRRFTETTRFMRNGARVWLAPIMDWTNTDMRLYRELLDLERNDVYDFMHTSGECLCGCFASDNELKELELWFPEVADRIKEIEEEIQEMYEDGELDVHNEDCLHWGHQNRKEGDEDDMDLENMPLCHDCGNS